MPDRADRVVERPPLAQPKPHAKLVTVPTPPERAPAVSLAPEPLEPRLQPVDIPPRVGAGGLPQLLEHRHAAVSAPHAAQVVFKTGEIGLATHDRIERRVDERPVVQLQKIVDRPNGRTHRVGLPGQRQSIFRSFGIFAHVPVSKR